MRVSYLFCTSLLLARVSVFYILAISWPVLAAYRCQKSDVENQKGDFQNLFTGLFTPIFGSCSTKMVSLPSVLALLAEIIVVSPNAQHGYRLSNFVTVLLMRIFE